MLYHCSADFFIEGTVRGVVLGFRRRWVSEPGGSRLRPPGPGEREREREPETERVHALRLPSESRSSPPLAPAPPPRPQKHKATEQDSTFRVEMNGLEEKAGNGPRPLLQSPCQGPTKKASRRCLRFFFIPATHFHVHAVFRRQNRQNADAAPAA